MEIIEFNPERNPSKTHDFAWQVKPHLSNLERIADQALRRAPSPLEVYALDRLGGTVGNAPWLDALPLHVGLAICDYMGMVQRFGREVSPSELTGRERMEAGGCGFSIAKSGEAGIREFMDELIRTYPYSRSATEGPQAVLGRWFKFIAFEARDASFEGVRAFVHNVLVERMPFGPGDTLLGKPVTRRVLHSVTSASQEMKVHPKRLRKILHAADVLTTDQLHLPNGNALFDAQAATETLLDAVDGLFMTEVETYLGAGRVRTKLLVDAGIVQPMFAKRPDLDHLFRRRDLDSFLDRLSLDAIPIEELAEDMADIQTAAKQACCGSMEIVRLILDRKLPWVGRLATVHGFAAIHVRLSEVRSAVQGSMEGWLTAKAIEHKLNTNTKVVRNLIDFGYLKSQKIKSPLNRCPVTVVSDGDFRCFDEKYISLFEIMRTTKIHFLQVKKRFKSINVVPSIRREEVGAAFYRRSDISYIWN